MAINVDGYGTAAPVNGPAQRLQTEARQGRWLFELEHAMLQTGKNPAPIAGGSGDAVDDRAIPVRGRKREQIKADGERGDSGAAVEQRAVAVQPAPASDPTPEAAAGPSLSIAPTPAPNPTPAPAPASMPAPASTPAIAPVIHAAATGNASVVAAADGAGTAVAGPRQAAAPSAVAAPAPVTGPAAAPSPLAAQSLHGGPAAVSQGQGVRVDPAAGNGRAPVGWPVATPSPQAVQSMYGAMAAVPQGQGVRVDLAAGDGAVPTTLKTVTTVTASASGWSLAPALPDAQARKAGADEGDSAPAPASRRSPEAEGDDYASRLLHVYRDADGVQAWVRDADIGTAQARQLAQSMAAELAGAGAPLTALTVNGQRQPLAVRSAPAMQDQDEYAGDGGAPQSAESPSPLKINANGAV